MLANGNDVDDSARGEAGGEGTAHEPKRRGLTEQEDEGEEEEDDERRGGGLVTLPPPITAPHPVLLYSGTRGCLPSPRPVALSDGGS
eukprot:5257465-Pyramimonas_sp.AAC.2